MNDRPHTVSVRFEAGADFSGFGQDVIAYVKKIDVDGRSLYSVCGADGSVLGLESTEALAMLIARQRNLFPVVVQ